MRIFSLQQRNRRLYKQKFYYYNNREWREKHKEKVKEYYAVANERNREVAALIKRDKILPLTSDIICVKFSFITCAMRKEKCDLCRCLSGCEFYKPIELIPTDGLHLEVRHR